MSLIDELTGMVKARLPKGGVRRVVRHGIEEVNDSQRRREVRREIHTRYLAKTGYREKNREKILAQMAAWRKANPEKVRANRARWAEKNPEKARLLKLKAKLLWKARNAAKVAAYDREYQKANRVTLRANKAAWYAANKDRINANRRRKRAGESNAKRETP